MWHVNVMVYGSGWYSRVGINQVMIFPQAVPPAKSSSLRISVSGGSVSMIFTFVAVVS